MWVYDICIVIDITGNLDLLGYSPRCSDHDAITRLAVVADHHDADFSADSLGFKIWQIRTS